MLEAVIKCKVGHSLRIVDGQMHFLSKEYLDWCLKCRDLISPILSVYPALVDDPALNRYIPKSAISCSKHPKSEGWVSCNCGGE